MREGIGVGGAAQIEGVTDEREAAHQVGEAIGPGVRGESRFRVVRSFCRSHPDRKSVV